MKTFEINDMVRFETGQGGMRKVVINGQHATAEIYLHGAHLTSFVPRGREPLLWMSDQSDFSETRAIRGGVPICWPWFGKLAGHPDLPQHGFARTSDWCIEATNVNDDGNVVVRLGLTDDEATRQWWPHPFQLSLEVIVATQLTIRLSFLNTGDHSVDVGTALHTYFAVERIENVKVSGLEGRSYIDQLDDGKIKPLTGSIEFDREIDRIVVDSDDLVTITESSSGRKIRVSKTGSQSTVVWNPWIDKSKKMADFPDEGYKTMLCIEAANAAEDVRTVPPGGTHEISQTIGYQ